jgi:hypothetical protein
MFHSLEDTKDMVRNFLPQFHTYFHCCLLIYSSNCNNGAKIAICFGVCKLIYASKLIGTKGEWNEFVCKDSN